MTLPRRRSSLKKKLSIGGSSERKPIRRSKSVQFDDDKPRIQRIPSISSFSKEEIEGSWYSEAEVETISYEADELVCKAEEQAPASLILIGSLEVDGESIRGLERKTSEGNTEAFLSRVGVYEAVIDEQEKHRGCGTTLNMEKIATLCGEASSQPKLNAIERAKQDEAEAMLYLKGHDTDTTFSSSDTSLRLGASVTKDWEAQENDESGNTVSLESDSSRDGACIY